MTDATVECWGNNNVGQLGLGHTNTPVTTPTAVTALGTSAAQLVLGGACAHHRLSLRAHRVQWREARSIRTVRLALAAASVCR